MNKQISIEDVPGYLVPVWGGWTWIDANGNECRWSKRQTAEECKAVVIDLATRQGIDAVEA